MKQIITKCYEILETSTTNFSTATPGNDEGAGEEERATTRSAKDEEQDEERPKVKRWAGTRKRKGETKKSVKAKSLLPLLFDVALPDEEQDPVALDFLRDARGKREKNLQEEDSEEEEEEAIAEEDGGESEGSKGSDQFQTIGLLMMQYLEYLFW